MSAYADLFKSAYEVCIRRLMHAYADLCLAYADLFKHAYVDLFKPSDLNADLFSNTCTCIRILTCGYII